VLLTTHPFLVPQSWKSRAIPLPTLWATTGPVTGRLFTLIKFFNILPLLCGLILIFYKFNYNIQCSPWKWLLFWSKPVGGHYVYKLI